MKDEYRAMLAKLQEERNAHQAHCEAEYLDDGHSVPRYKLDMLYEIAYDFGHSSGWNEIELYYDQLVPLVK